MAGTLVSPERPFAAQGDWLQVIDTGFLQNTCWILVLHLAFIRTHIQVLVPESFLEEFHAQATAV